MPAGLSALWAWTTASGTFLTSAQHLRGWDERRLAIAQAAEKAAHTCNLLAHHCIDGPTITRGGAGATMGSSARTARHKQPDPFAHQTFSYPSDALTKQRTTRCP